MVFCEDFKSDKLVLKGCAWKEVLANFLKKERFCFDEKK